MSMSGSRPGSPVADPSLLDAEVDDNEYCLITHEQLEKHAQEIVRLKELHATEIAQLKKSHKESMTGLEAYYEDKAANEMLMYTGYYNDVDSPAEKVKQQQTLTDLQSKFVLLQAEHEALKVNFARAETEISALKISVAAAEAKNNTSKPPSVISRFGFYNQMLRPLSQNFQALSGATIMAVQKIHKLDQEQPLAEHTQQTSISRPLLSPK
jgi:hypothetical protein